MKNVINKQLEFTIPEDLDVQEDPQEQSSLQSQIQQPPK